MTSQLVPAYIWPTDDPAWDRALTGPPGIVVVTGDNSGPGTSRSPILAARITDCVRRRWAPIGYVRLDYGRRPIADIASDIATWKAWFGDITGLFFDEAPAGRLAELVPLLAEGARRCGGRFVLNPGVPVGADVWAATWPLRGLVVTYEGTAAAYPGAGAQVHARAVHLVHQAPVAPVWPHGLGWAWSTPDGADGNPWDEVAP